MELGELACLTVGSDMALATLHSKGRASRPTNYSHFGADNIWNDESTEEI